MQFCFTEDKRSSRASWRIWIQKNHPYWNIGNTQSFHNADNADLFNILEIVLDKSIPGNIAREKAIQYSEEHETDKSVIMTVAGATNSKIDYNAFEKGDGKMCTLFDTIAKENEIKGRKEGHAEGKVEGKVEEIIETGYEFNLSEEDILERLQKKMNVSLQKAQEYFNMFKKQEYDC